MPLMPVSNLESSGIMKCNFPPLSRTDSPDSRNLVELSLFPKKKPFKSFHRVGDRHQICLPSDTSVLDRTAGVVKSLNLYGEVFFSAFQPHICVGLPLFSLGGDLGVMSNLFEFLHLKGVGEGLVRAVRFSWL